MAVVVQNVNFSVRISLMILKLAGLWLPDEMDYCRNILYKMYSFIVFMIFVGTYVMIQVVDMFVIWGNLPLMTGTAFLLGTNLAHTTKIVNIVVRKPVIEQIIRESDGVLREESSLIGKRIVKSCDRETLIQQVFYFCLTTITVFGWASSAEKNQLPLRAWYPYDTSLTPAYEITYVHQVVGLFVAAYLNVSKDTLVTSLVAQCRCRLRLLALRLRTLSEDLSLSDKHLATPEQELLITSRLRACVVQHQATLDTVELLETCFSIPTFAQLFISMIIICVTAFQMSAFTSNPIRLVSMGTYLLNMVYQVFIYCYQGNQLSEESTEIAGAAYECQWYRYSTQTRRLLLVVMARSRRIVRIKAAGFTTINLASFMAIIKTSYSMFTLLQQVNEKK